MNRPLEDIVLVHDGEFITNVPALVCHHSPTGYSWGYHGSGPADLALNVLEWALRDRGYTGHRVKCWRGDCFGLAWDLHQQFKSEVIALIDPAGGTISADFVRVWLKGHVDGNE